PQPADEQIEEEIRSAFNTNVMREPVNPEPVLSAEEEAALLDFEVISKQPDRPEVKPETVEPAIGAELELDTELPPMEEPGGGPVLEITPAVEQQATIEEENKAATLVEQFGEYDPTLDLGSYVFPHFDLLNDYGSIHSKVNQEEL